MSTKKAMTAVGYAATLGLFAPLVQIPAAAQQPINVTVDGDLVAFGAQKPIQQFGTVLVPLRGVFEKLGATVAFDNSTKTVLAVRGATTVSIQLGSREARVNDMPRQLSVPAQAINGTTLVPLRFVSEALGAQVKWQPASQTVIVSTTGSGSGAPVATNPANGGGANPAPAQVSSLTHSAASGTLHSGDTLNVRLQGTPGGVASFSIPGVESARNVTMRETSPGEYTGVFTVPNGISVKGATVLASLKVGSLTSPLIQSGQPITIDSIGPEFGSLSPAPGATITPSKPLVYGTFTDAGSGINTQNVRLIVEGKDVTDQATITEAFFSYRPAADLTAGKKEVVVSARDVAGNETRKAWGFTVAAGENPIKSVEVLPKDKTLEPGDVVTVQLSATPGGSARFSLGDAVKDRSMSEVSPGQYQGTYTIKRGDILANAPVSVTYKATSGRETTQSVSQAVSIAAGAPVKPTILTPKADSSVGGDKVVITGKASPGATVRYAVRYTGLLLIVPTEGPIADGEVKADADGNWKTPEISLSTPGVISKVSYSLSAATVGATPTETSDAATVSFRR